MTKLSINLLPQEALAASKAEKRFKTIRFLSTIFFLGVVFLASATVALRIFQNHTLGNVKVQADEKEKQVEDFKDKESDLVLVKDRINIIKQLRSLPSKSREAYETVINEIPGNIIISGVAVESGGDLTLSTTVPDEDTLGVLISNLSSEALFKQISKLDVDNLSRGKDGSYRISIRVGVR